MKVLFIILKRSRDFLLYTKKKMRRVLFYNKNMAVTFTSHVNLMN